MTAVEQVFIYGVELAVLQPLELSWVFSVVISEAVSAVIIVGNVF